MGTISEVIRKKGIKKNAERIGQEYWIAIGTEALTDFSILNPRQSQYAPKQKLEISAFLENNSLSCGNADLRDVISDEISKVIRAEKIVTIYRAALPKMFMVFANTPPLPHRSSVNNARVIGDDMIAAYFVPISF